MKKNQAAFDAVYEILERDEWERLHPRIENRDMNTIFHNRVEDIVPRLADEIKFGNRPPFKFISIDPNWECPHDDDDWSGVPTDELRSSLDYWTRRLPELYGPEGGVCAVFAGQRSTAYVKLAFDKVFGQTANATAVRRRPSPSATGPRGLAYNDEDALFVYVVGNYKANPVFKEKRESKRLSKDLVVLGENLGKNWSQHGTHWTEGPERINDTYAVKEQKGKFVRYTRHDNNEYGIGLLTSDLGNIAPPWVKEWKTEKAQELLAVLLLQATNKNDWVLDLYSGSGTTAIVAEQFGRRWVAVDNAEESITKIKARLNSINDEADLNQWFKLDPKLGVVVEWNQIILSRGDRKNVLLCGAPLWPFEVSAFEIEQISTPTPTEEFDRLFVAMNEADVEDALCKELEKLKFDSRRQRIIPEGRLDIVIRKDNFRAIIEVKQAGGNASAQQLRYSRLAPCFACIGLAGIPLVIEEIVKAANE